MQSISAKVHSSIDDIPAAAWDACANPAPETFDPFISHAFLAALEHSGCVGEGTGWQPCHLALQDAAGDILAVMPLYSKTHSQGEYVFDHAFADAYHRAGGRYYPKLQCAVPFSPVTGRRLLVHPDTDRNTAESVLLSGALTLADKIAASSLHVTFLSPQDAERCAARGLLMRTGQQFHWVNPGYRSFEDFLATLTSRKRKAIRRERAEIAASGLVIEALTGAKITPAHWDAMFAFYLDTGSRKWGRPYLNRAFFRELGETLADRCLLILALEGDTPVAGALHLIGGDCLYGRYWGCTKYVPSLHFELCYYQAIDAAIARGFSRIEAGAQGEHKLARGYLPVTTHSAHWFADERLARGVAHYLEQERRAVAESNAALTTFGPYRQALTQEQDG